MNIVYVGIDLAKNRFAVHGVDETGKPAPYRRPQRVQAVPAFGLIRNFSPVARLP